MKRVIAFLGTALGVWPPLVIWATINTYVFNHEDFKLGKGQGILVVAMIWGVLALLSACGGQLTYAIRKREIDSISVGVVFWLHLVSGLFLSAISFPFLYKCGKLVGLTHPLIFVTWFTISILVTYLGIKIYTHLFRREKH